MTTDNDQVLWTRDSTDWFKPYITEYGRDAPSLFPRVLAEYMPNVPGAKRLLDIGCGSGIIGLYCLLEKKAFSVTFNDLFPDWIDITRRNLDVKIAANAIQPGQASFAEPGSFETIDPEVVRRHDLLSFNPPQLPTAFVDEASLLEIEKDSVQSGFRISGEDGLAIPRQFFDWYRRLETPKPDAVIILSSFLGRRNIGEAITSSHLSVQGGTPIGVRVELRKMLRDHADDFSQSPDEMEDRYLMKVNGVWTKKLLIYRLNNS